MARERWDKRSAFIMAAIGSAIGLGNVWRFPYVAYANGGGAFFIPYFIALLTTGIPLLALELYLGIRYQNGPTEAYGIVRKNTNFIGWFALGVAAMITAYYTVVMGWTWNFIAHSFQVNWAGQESDFFYDGMLKLSDSIWNLGGLRWIVVLGNFLTWVAIFLIVYKGVKVVGKIVNWTVGIPWVLLLILLIRGVTLRGAEAGLDFYLNPDFSMLLEPRVWLAAYSQIFFSLSLGFGVMIAYASYLDRESDIHTNAWMIAFSNSATSFFAGFAVFSVLGYLAMETGSPVDSVVKAGPGLAFVVYPTAIAKLPGGVFTQAVFGILFFFMLLTLGIDSAFSLVEAIITGIKDTFKGSRKKVTFWVCLTGFLAGLIYCTHAGLYWLDVVDRWMNWGLLIVGLVESILIGWMLKTREFGRDMDRTSEMKMGRFWFFCIRYITPVILLIILGVNFYEEILDPYENYPIWALMTGGWGLVLALMFISLILQKHPKIGTVSKWKWISLFLLHAALFFLFYFLYKSTRPLAILMGSLFFGILLWGIVHGFNAMFRGMHLPEVEQIQKPIK